MSYRFSFGLLAAVSLLAISTSVADAKKNKGPDPMLEQAIKDTAQTAEPIEEPALIKPAPLEPEDKIVAQPEDDGDGFKVGSLRFLPSLGLQSGFESNVYRTDDDEVDDYFVQALPKLSIVLEDSAHEAEFTAEYDYKTFLDQSDEERHNYGFAFDGRARLTEGAHIPLHVSWAQLHEQREDDLTQQIPDEPIGYEVFKAKGGLELKPGPFGFKFLGDYLSKTHDNGTARGTGTAIVRDDADHDVIAGEAEVSYDLSDTITAYIGGRYGERSYDRQNFTGGTYSGVDRDSTEWSSIVGTRMTFKNLSTDMYVGYADFDYDDGGVSDVQDVIAGLDLEWDITELTDIVIGFNRYVYEDDEVVDPIMRSRVDAQLRHLFADRWLLSTGGGYEIFEFEGSDREDNMFDVGFGVDYLINDKLSIGAGYEYQNRDSDAMGLDFENHIALIRLNGKL